MGGRGSGSCKPTIYSSKSVGTSTKCTDEKQLYSHSRILPLLPWHDATSFACPRCCVATQRHLTEGAQEPRLGQTKTFRKDSEASLRAEGGRGYVIIFNNESSCCYVATSFYYTDLFKLGGEAVSKRKHFAKAAKPLRGRKEGAAA